MISNPETRRCGRCGGNMFLDKDLDGWFEECLQCGHRRDIKVVKRDYTLQKELRTAASGIDNIKKG